MAGHDLIRRYHNPQRERLVLFCVERLDDRRSDRHGFCGDLQRSDSKAARESGGVFGDPPGCEPSSA